MIIKAQKIIGSEKVVKEQPKKVVEQPKKKIEVKKTTIAELLADDEEEDK